MPKGVAFYREFAAVDEVSMVIDMAKAKSLWGLMRLQN